MLVIVVYKSDGSALCFCSGRSSDAVHIIFTIRGHIVIDDQFNVVNMDATAQDISCNQNRKPFGGKLQQYIFSLALVQIRLDVFGIVLHPLQLRSQLFYGLFF